MGRRLSQQLLVLHQFGRAMRLQQALQAWATAHPPTAIDRQQQRRIRPSWQYTTHSHQPRGRRMLTRYILSVAQLRGMAQLRTSTSTISCSRALLRSRLGRQGRHQRVHWRSSLLHQRLHRLAVQPGALRWPRSVSRAWAPPLVHLCRQAQLRCLHASRSTTCRPACAWCHRPGSFGTGLAAGLPG